jgi:glycosyltransferase involved in cell wall biosynthesis
MIIGLDASRALHSRPTGTEQYARTLIHHLLALPTAPDHHWRLYVDHLPRAGEPWADTPLPPWADWRILPPRRAWTHRALGPEVWRHRPDVLFVPSHLLPLLPKALLPPTVVTVHDLGYIYFPAAHPLRQRLYLTWGTRWSVAAATRVIAVSQATARDLLHHAGATPAQVQVVYEAVDAPPQPALSAAAHAQSRRRLGLEGPYALYVGTIQPRKNLVRLVEAFTRIAPTVGWDLVLAGGAGWLSDDILAACAASAAADRIHRLGYVAADDLAALWAGAQSFLFPSLYEGFGLPILEAQRAGVPVMTAQGSSLPEVGGDAALYVDPTDVEAIAQAMLQLSQDEALRQRLIEAGHANVRRFSWTKAAAETLAVLEEAAKSRRTSP